MKKLTVTSAALSANQTVTNKAYILLSRLGVTDMVEDSTIACQYFSGSGTNQIVFRGELLLTLLLDLLVSMVLVSVMTLLVQELSLMVVLH